jgi:hypothetical protein
MDTDLQRAAFDAFVRNGNSPVPPSEIEKPIADGSYRTSAANAGLVFWRAATAKNVVEKSVNDEILDEIMRKKSRSDRIVAIVNCATK